MNVQLCTSGFISFNNSTTTSPRFFPIDPGSTKKLFAKSLSVTVFESTIVTWPQPGKTKFLMDSVPVGPAFNTQIFALDKARWPCAPHKRSCLSYLLSVAIVYSSLAPAIYDLHTLPMWLKGREIAHDSFIEQICVLFSSSSSILLCSVEDVCYVEFRIKSV